MAQAAPGSRGPGAEAGYPGTYQLYCAWWIRYYSVPHQPDVQALGPQLASNSGRGSECAFFRRCIARV